MYGGSEAGFCVDFYVEVFSYVYLYEYVELYDG